MERVLREDLHNALLSQRAFILAAACRGVTPEVQAKALQEAYMQNEHIATLLELQLPNAMEMVTLGQQNQAQIDELQRLHDLTG